MAIWLYRLIFAPLLLLATPVLIWKMLRRGDYKEGLSTRFGAGLRFPAKRQDVKRIWVQAVSLGELMAIEPLLEKWLADERKEIFLTCSTSTGYRLASNLYGDRVAALAYFPLDFWLIARSVWRKAQPDLAIVAETELWPEHMQQARASRTPLVIVNGRLSDKAYRNTARLASLFRKQFGAITQVLAGSQLDAERFASIGLPPSSVEFAGNTKLDVEIKPLMDAAQRDELQRSLGLGNGFALLGSSTWPGEEAALLETFRALRECLPYCRLLIAPRHGERRDEIARLLSAEAKEFSWALKSEGLPQGEVDILVADTHGELRTLTQLADLAFIGKSLPPHCEGQTPVECGVLGVPMLLGPGMDNFREIRAQLIASGAAIQIDDAGDLRRKALDIALDPEQLEGMSKAGLSWFTANRGSIERYLREIDRILA